MQILFEHLGNKYIFFREILYSTPDSLKVKPGINLVKKHPFCWFVGKYSLNLIQIYEGVEIGTLERRAVVLVLVVLKSTIVYKLSKWN